MNTRVLMPALLGSISMLAGCGGGGSDGGNAPPPGQSGSIQFGTTALTVDEGVAGTTAEFTVTRTGGSDGVVSVTVEHAGTATVLSDYSLDGTIVTFANGDASSKTLRVTVADDGEVEADETLALTLTTPTGGAIVGASASATLTIKDNDPPAAPVLEAATSGHKTLTFSWTAVPGATSYKLLTSPHESFGFSTVSQTTDTTATLEIAVHQLDWVNARYQVQACNSRGCSPGSQSVSVLDAMLDAIATVKASSPATADEFGFSASLSGDGKTLAVGAPFEDSGSAGTSNVSVPDSGAVYVYVRTGSQWSQQAFVKASNAREGDCFGISVSLNENGSMLAVGAPNYDGTIDAGTVFIFTRTGTQWSQQAYVKASTPKPVGYDFFGESVALSDDGSTLAVGASGQDTGGLESGAVYVFTIDGTEWVQQGFLKAFNGGEGDMFGTSIALSDSGDTLAVGAIGEDSSAAGDPTDDASEDSGAAYVFARTGSSWSLQAFVKPSLPLPREFDRFGRSIALSGDGSTLAVGAADQGAKFLNIGAAYIFTMAETQWSQQAFVKSPYPQLDDAFGISVALNKSGDTLAVGADFEDSKARGVGGDASDNSFPNAGAAYTFKRTGTEWTPQAYVKAKAPVASDGFGFSVSLSADGATLAVGAPGQDGGTIDSGAVLIY